MADSLSVAVERLRTSSERLNAICDSAAQTVRDTEAYLETLQLGVSAWVDVCHEYDDDDAMTIIGDVRLGYSEQSNGKYRIAVVWSPRWADCASDVTVKSWVECSRDDKLRSFEKLPYLLVELANKLDEKITKAEKTVTAVTNLLPPSKKKKGA